MAEEQKRKVPLPARGTKLWRRYGFPMQRTMQPKSVESVEMDHARSVSGNALKSLIHAAGEDILLAVLDNPNLEEPHAALLLNRLDLTPRVLSAVAAKKNWISSEAVRLRLTAHPHTPKRIALAAIRQLYLFDLVRLSLLPSAPADIKRVAEGLIVARVPHLPVGEKLTLARRGPSRVAGALLAEGHPQAIKLALGNALLSESQVLKVLANPGVPERVVAAIAQHPKWSCQYNVRVALIRNVRAPLQPVLEFLPHITGSDLKEISRIEGLPPRVKKYILQDLVRRRSAKEDTQ